ncbi:ras-specific guanine nucleotide-releasing factor 1-like [Dysidea avara]|uniref:ras-specific guanine nucleotide-releasing factor 1-like n=1 Tax=Dysidea avara TaxID=196820 RepID=UPI00331F0D50
MLSPTKDFSLSGGRLSPSPRARYGDPSSQLLQQRNIMLSIYANLNYWLSQHKEDFLYNKSLKDKLLSFLESHMEKVATRDRQQLELAEETLQKLQEVTSDDGVIDKSITNMLLRTIQPEFGLGALGWVEMTERPMSNSSIINLHHKQLARQLMLLEYALYTAIERRELVGCCWKRKNKEKEAPNVCRVIKHSNKLTSWVMTSILQQETVHGRAAAIELFIRVASDCLKHNDAQSSVLITCALNSCCVRHDRLKLSWEQVPSKFRQKYDKLVKFSNPDRHCRAMRSHLEKQQAPGVPYTGGYLEHIWAIENVQKTYTPEGLVNFSKMTALCNAIRSFLCFQSEPYEFEPDFKLMHYVMAAERLDDEELYHLSKEREP